ncbi:MAG TPA: AraC family transcriptional regulator [Sulfurospirillum arcachonense]|nr:AraC family transcriptional regulator [Sulfurospirillum arcachonense]
MSIIMPNLLEASFTNKTFAPHFHDEYSIALITSGTHNFTCNKNDFAARPGDIRLINPHDIHVCKSKTWGYITFTPDSNFVEAFSESCQKELHNITFVNPVIHNHKLAKLFMDLNSATKEWQDELMAENILEELVVNLISSYSNNESKTKNISYSRKKLLQSVEYIKSNFDESLKLEDLAHISGLSKYHFLRKFKEEFNMTPHSYLLQIRIQNAKNMLIQNRSLCDIAFSCGFSDQSHFTRVFNKIYGMTPRKLVS